MQLRNYQVHHGPYTYKVKASSHYINLDGLLIFYNESGEQDKEVTSVFKDWSMFEVVND